VKRYVLTLDLVDDAAGVAAYLRHHRAVWPEVARSLRRVGIAAMDIYRLERRLVMVMDTRDDFDLKRSFAAHRTSDPRCAEWEDLMKTFQRSPPGARPGQLWTPMARVFRLRRPARRKRTPRR
jgi:L-rhamnose mutarotase